LSLKYNAIEEESIVLKAIWDLAQDCVNYSIFCKFSDPANVTLLPNTHNDLRLFNILVGDFLSAPKPGTLGLPGIPSAAQGADRTYLAYLRRVVKNPQLASGRERLIAEPTECLASWLEADFTVKDVWLPKISFELDVTMTRLESIKICGNIAKHNFSRLSADVDKIRRILNRNGRPVTEEEAYLLLPDFYEWFHTHIFAYHTSQIGEMLNNILWGMYDYLLHEFARAYRETKLDDPGDVMYGYDVPAGIRDGLAKAMYWDLMNDVRRKPYMPRFNADRALTVRY
jgi:hypothetical protein